MRERFKPSRKLVPLYVKELLEQKTDSEHRVSLEEIENYLSSKDLGRVDRRTNYDAISVLTIAGMDIDGQQGGGTYGYYLRTRLFDRQELKGLIDAVAASKYLTLEESKKLIEKIKQILMPQALSISELTRWTVLCLHGSQEKESSSEKPFTLVNIISGYSICMAERTLE